MDAETTLRGRKKARRRDEMIAAAKRLFEEKGVDATTIADIAEATDVSAPTVFNYFGSKDGLLVAIIEEGTQSGRASELFVPPLAGETLDKVVLDLFSRISRETLEIASRRVWRYAEASVIRHPETELAQRYNRIVDMLIEAIAQRLDLYDLDTRSGAPLEGLALARFLHDLWEPCFVALITNPGMTLADHDALVAERVLPLLDFVFEEDSRTAPRLRQKGEIA